jgi:hypothetical protein
MPPTVLPTWLVYIQAFAIPFMAVVIAATGAWVALQQMHLAHVKLKHDLYDRRFTVFESAYKMLKEIIVRGDASDEAIREFLLGTANAPFLLNDDIVLYLEEIGRYASTIQIINNTLKSSFDDNKIEMEARLSESQIWVQEQPVVLVKKFIPFLKLERQHIINRLLTNYVGAGRPGTALDIFRSGKNGAKSDGASFG